MRRLTGLLVLILLGLVGGGIYTLNTNLGTSTNFSTGVHGDNTVQPLLSAYIVSNTSGTFLVYRVSLSKPVYVFGMYFGDPSITWYQPGIPGEAPRGTVIASDFMLRPGVHVMNITRLVHPANDVDVGPVWMNNVIISDKEYPLSAFGKVNYIKPVLLPPKYMAYINIRIADDNAPFMRFISTELNLTYWSIKLYNMLAYNGSKAVLEYAAKKIFPAIVESVLNGTSRAGWGTFDLANPDALRNDFMHGKLWVIVDIDIYVNKAVAIINRTDHPGISYYLVNRTELHLSMQNKPASTEPVLTKYKVKTEQVLETAVPVAPMHEYGLLIIYGKTPYSSKHVLKTVVKVVNYYPENK